LEGISANQVEEIKKRGITDIEKVASLTVDDLVDMLDISLDDAEKILNSARSIIAAREEIKGKSKQKVEAQGENDEGQSGVSTKAEV
jgi:hypothetical protein